MMHVARFRGAAFFCVPLVFGLAACGVGASGQGTVEAKSAHSVASVGESVPTKGPALESWIDYSDFQHDGIAYQSLVAASGVRDEPTSVGAASLIQVALGGNGGSWILKDSMVAQPSLLSTGSGETMSLHDAGSLLFVLGADAYVQLGSEIVEYDPEKSAIKTFPLPAMPIVNNPDQTDGHPRLIAGPATPTLGGLVQRSNGDRIGFVSDTNSAVAFNLDTGELADLVGFSGILGGASTSDGYFYTVAWDESVSDATLHLLRIDPDKLTVVNSWDTGIRPGGSVQGPVDNVHVMVAGADSVVLAIATNAAAADGSTGPETVQFWRTAGDKFNAMATAPKDSGLKASLVDPDHVLLYGGPAKNLVTVFDIADGSAQADPTLDGPSGTYMSSIEPSS